ncbi:related to delta3,5-delta2,4-dienoyl-coa isomerase precursor [Melanopsichium pennsylvanicum]|uniref:Related to delta3,5-delta2,4-dienoyl-coa isomerase n=2 Tax=Melanopsichium pennsylvanicum TaxID=63383 RepID=A0AAJ4XJM1_9BASI|nr:related to delta3,5-delta2,4-dienoyl-coa isomerase precursor [Melanopsichium pennsylvanicum 4]SNX82931.1 related to delta3,5-delta2,4-dienoyl-coa isomerase precursor [Melanopsichium pennsylvanicum]
MSFPQLYTGYPNAKYHKLTLPAPGVLLLSFNRPPVNAWIDPKWQELALILRYVRDDPDVSCIVVAGEGRCFTAGLDLNAQSLGSVLADAPDAARRAFSMRSHLRDFQEAISWFEYVEKPVIAAAHGVAFGLAIDIMSACDIRYATKDTRYSIKEVDAGLAADIGTLQRFPKIVGNDSLARELCYTAREFDSAEAREIGFLSKIIDGGRNEVVAAAIKTASDIASKAPVAVRGTKIYLLHSRDHGVEEGLKYVQALNSALLQSDDMSVAMLAVMQKKTPKFAKL